MSSLSAQGNISDSLRKELGKARTHASHAELYIALSQEAMARDYKQALDHAQEAVFAARQDGAHSLLMRSYKALASVEFFIGLYDQAFVHFNKAAEQAEFSGDHIEAVNNRFNIVLMHLTLKEYDKGIRRIDELIPQLRAAYRKAGKEIPLADQIGLYQNLSFAYTGAGQFSKAYQYLDSGINLLGAAPDPGGTLFKLLITKGKAKLKEQKFHEAIELFIQAESRMAPTGDMSQHLLLHESRMEAYEKLGEHDNALQVARAGLLIARSVGIEQMKEDFAKGMARIFRVKGASDSAIHYLDLAAEYQQASQTALLREEMMRKELLEEFKQKERELAERNNEARRRILYEVLLVTLIALCSVVGVVYYRRRYRRMNLRRLQQELEARQLDLERRRLEAELSRKDSELERINYDLKKYSLIGSLIGELQQQPSNDEQQGRLTSSQNRMKAWEEFEYRFQQIHSGFYERLKQSHPDLSLNERRLCAFLKLDMNSKEISDITGQSVRAIHVGRFRLRKKLGLTNTDTDIFDYLARL